MAQQVRVELSQLCFARIARLVVREEHVTETGHVRTYHGYAIPIMDRKKHMIWFQLSSHVRRPIAIGPVRWDVRPPTLTRMLPRIGDVIFGEHLSAPRGRMYRWWSSQGEPVLELLRLLMYRSRKPRFDSLVFFRRRPCFHCRRCEHPVYPRDRADDGALGQDSVEACFVCGHTLIDVCRCPPHKSYWPCDDLWVMYRILVRGDYSTLLRILREPKHSRTSPKNPSLNGLHLSHDPFRFVFFLTWFARDARILETFLTLAAKEDQAYAGEGSGELDEYSLDTLRVLCL